MHSPTLARPLRLGRPWPQRLADDLGETLGAWLQAARLVWRHRQAQWRERREIEAATELSDVTLRDMGAPDWLVAQAHARRESLRFERELLHVEPRSGDTFRHY